MSIGDFLFGGSGESSWNRSFSDPWAGVQPYLADAYGQAYRLQQLGGTAPYPGQTVAPFNALQQQGFGQLQQHAGGWLANQYGQHLAHMASGPQNPYSWQYQAMRGNAMARANPLSQVEGPGFWGRTQAWNQPTRAQQGAAGQGLLHTALGAGMDPNNPGMKALLDHGRGMIERSNALGASRYGSLGGSMAPLAAAQQQGALLAGTYDAERNRQVAAQQQLTDLAQQQRQWAVGQAPSLQALHNQNTDRLIGLGDRLQGHSQSMLDAERNRYYEAQEEPWRHIERYLNLITGRAPMSSRAVGEGESSSTGGIGGLLSGLGALGWRPFG